MYFCNGALSNGVFASLWKINIEACYARLLSAPRFGIPRPEQDLCCVSLPLLELVVLLVLYLLAPHVVQPFSDILSCIVYCTVISGHATADGRRLALLVVCGMVFLSDYRYIRTSTLTAIVDTVPRLTFYLAQLQGKARIVKKDVVVCVYVVGGWGVGGD